MIVEESELREKDEAKRLAKQKQQQQEAGEEEVQEQESGIGAVSFISCAMGSEIASKIDQDEPESKSLSFPSLFCQ